MTNLINDLVTARIDKLDESISTCYCADRLERLTEAQYVLIMWRCLNTSTHGK